MTKLLFDGERSFKQLQKLAVGIGTRPGGTEEERRAAE